MSLNHAQREAVSHHKGPCMVLAGPGSGKTLTIAKRIEYLIEKIGLDNFEKYLDLTIMINEVLNNYEEEIC